ncbi:hypothetical protein M9H77_17994 [Catharanthus roseus]|uniref:Uncharacterized protein n=1 Tax=Catharanthus roseus TaxID=4058 RepID=A0ACC0B687_CATRO|nr:hypothetical protein M9H77_17994 [Catharanthus roseus]
MAAAHAWKSPGNQGTYGALRLELLQVPHPAGGFTPNFGYGRDNIQTLQGSGSPGGAQEFLIVKILA